MVIFTQFSNRPAWSLYLEAPGRKTAPLGDRGGCSVPEGGFASWTSASLGAVDGFCSPSTLTSSCSENSVQTVPWPRVMCVWQQGQQEGWWVLYGESAKCSNAFSFFPLSFYSFLYTFLLNVPLSAPRLSYCPQHLLSYCLLFSWWEDNDLVSSPHSSDVSGAALISQLLHYMIKSVVVTDRPARTVEAPGVTGSTGPSGIHSHYSYTLYIPISI